MRKPEFEKIKVVVLKDNHFMLEKTAPVVDNEVVMEKNWKFPFAAGHVFIKVKRRGLFWRAYEPTLFIPDGAEEPLNFNSTDVGGLTVKATKKTVKRVIRETLGKMNAMTNWQFLGLAAISMIGLVILVLIAMRLRVF